MPKISVLSTLPPTKQWSSAATGSVSCLPIEVLEQIFLRLSERDLRQRVSPVCRQWHSISHQFIRRIAIWNINYSQALKSAKKALLGRLSTGLVNTLACNFASEDDSSEQSLAAWNHLTQALTCPLGQGTPLERAKRVFKSAQDPHSKDTPCVLHQIREIRFERCYDVLKCLQSFAGRLEFLQALVITHFVRMYDSPLSLSELLLVCPALKRLEIAGFVLDSVHEVSSSSDTTTLAKSKRIYGLVEFTARGAHVDAGTLNMILSSCPYLVAFIVQEVRLLSTDDNHRFGVFSTYSIQEQMKGLVQNARVLCPRLKSIALTTESSYWTDMLMLLALAEPHRTTSQEARTLNQSRSASISTSSAPTTVRQLTLRCDGRDICLHPQALDTQILVNLKELHIASHHAGNFQEHLQLYLSICSSLEHLIVDRKLALRVDEMVDIFSFPFPPGSRSSPPNRFLSKEFLDLDLLDEFAPPTNWSFQDFMEMPEWIKERAMLKQPDLRRFIPMDQTGQVHPDQGAYVPVDNFPTPIMPLPGTPFPPFPQFQPQAFQSTPFTPFTPSPQFPQLTPSLFPAPMFSPVYVPAPSIPPTKIPRKEILKWACHNLLTLEMCLTEGEYAFAVLGSYLVDHCPNLESILIQYPLVRFGQIEVHSQLQTLNELLPWRGLTRMRRFAMVVDMIGPLGAKDFAFLASQQSDDTMNMESSCSACSSVSESKDVFWPNLQEFELALNPLHMAGEMAKREDIRYLRGNHMQRALAKMRPQVAFVFGHNIQV